MDSLLRKNAPPGLPNTQKAVIIEKPGPDARVSIQEISVPQPQPDEVLIRLSHTGVCHADVAFIFGEWEPLGFGIEGSKTPGHEGVGVVAAIGTNVANLKVGDRVGTKWLRNVCWRCTYCKAGNENMCVEQTHFGRSTPGSFQQYLTSPAVFTPKIPRGIPDEKAGPLLCAGVTMYRALKMSRLHPNDWVVISGAGGGLGHLGSQFAKKMGYRVVGIDSGVKEQLCSSTGVDHFIDFQKASDIPGEVVRITEGGAHSLLVTSGSKSAYLQAKSMLRSGGSLICIGLPVETFDVPIQPLDMLTHGYTVTGVNASGLKDIQEALEFAAAHDISPVVRVFPIKDAAEAFSLLQHGHVTGRLVLDLR